MTHKANPRTHAMLRARFEACAMLGVFIFKAISTAAGDAEDSEDTANARRF